MPIIFKKLSLELHYISKGWVALAGLLIFLLFTALVLPGQSLKAEQVSGESGSPDTSFFYSPADLARMAEAYGEQGRQGYVRARFTFDLIFPIVYTFFLITSISWVFAKVFSASSRWQLANLVPLLGMLCDYLENITASFVMLRYPAPAGIAATLAPLFTVMKWGFIGLSFGLLVIGILAGLWKWIRRADQPSIS
jgi:hypothetical protein